MKKVRVAVIGLGNWGECHVEAYRSIPQAEIAAVCDTRKDRLDEVAGRFGVADRYTDYEQLLQRGDIDLVNVATFEENHFPVVQRALQSGIHVLVEKPVSTKLAEAEAMLAAASRNDRHIIAGHLLRFEPRYAEIYKAIQSGKLGQPESMFFRRARTKGMFRMYSRSHTVYLSTVHDLDLAIWYANSRVKTVKAYARAITGHAAPDILWACLEFASGAIAVFSSNWMTPDEAGIVMNDAVEIIGSRATAQFDNRGTGLEIWGQAGRETADLGIHQILNGQATGALREQLSYLCDCIGSGTPPSHTSFQDAVHGIEVANAIVQSASTGKEISL